MPYINILENCVFSIGGLKEFKIASRDEDENTLDFPLDVTFQTGSTDTILIEEDLTGRTLTIGGTVIEFRLVMPFNVDFLEEEIEDRRGKYYKKTLTFSIPSVNLDTQNQIKDFLFNTDGDFATNGVLLYFTDSNDQNWLANYSVPFILESLELQTGAKDGDNYYRFVYVCNDYHRTTKYELI